MTFLCSCNVFDDTSKLNDQGVKALARKDYKSAGKFFSKATDSLERQLSGSSPEEPDANAGIVRQLCVAYANIGKLHMDQGSYTNAAGWFEKSLQIYGKRFGTTDQFAAGLMTSLSFCLFHVGKYEEAALLSKRELTIYQEKPTANALRIAITANNLAQIYEKLDQNEEAEKYFQWALNLAERGKKKTCMTVEIDILNNYALFCRRTESYGQAKQLAQRAIALQRRYCPGFSPDKVKSLFVLAGIESASYEIEEAEKHYNEGLKLIEEHPGGSPALQSEGLHLYGELLLSERRFREAQPLLEQSLEISTKLHGPRHPLIAERLTDLAILGRRTGRLADAEHAIRSAVDINLDALGIDSRVYLDSFNNMTAVLEDEGKTKEAYSLYGELIPLLIQKLGPNHPYVADALDNWAMFAARTGEINAGEKLRQKARAIRVNQKELPGPVKQRYILPPLKTKGFDV